MPTRQSNRLLLSARHLSLVATYISGADTNTTDTTTDTIDPILAPGAFLLAWPRRR
ncbi:hypothetical protein PF002_g27936 [Phytophthora fragariae]|uniref:Uncharacterized protein n=1 Tax=Phytophthora fragariae TaxID=53985 RepID=A0A6A3DIX9_9STRA|nr:hypothetical protein PF003_g24497 [Phytophthora fragariae]KAE8921802.1 hypothetical protein PF009_g27925 [Phytophthora fragariae]KAE9144130.1 hypothetical protein PF006_g10904 [Phytophthora fragariae]KAE9178973.1 hypothetical protein PF002_g27936 [Phytophthora fragariae]